MLASNFYRQDMVCGKGTGKRDACSAPRLTSSSSSSKITVPSNRGRPRGGRGALSNAPPKRQILVEVNRNRSRPNDHDDNEEDSDKENEELEDLVTEGQADEVEQEEEEEIEEEFDLKCRLLETIQLYPELFDLADPR